MSREWCCVLATAPTPPGRWKKNVWWVQANQKSIVRKLWLPVPLDPAPAHLGTQLAESEVAAGSAEILWRLHVPGVVVVPPQLTSIVARHIKHEWAAEDRQDDGHQLVCQLKEYALRAELLVLPFQSESHWTRLALE